MQMIYSGDEAKKYFTFLRDKIEFGKPEKKWLGYVISTEGIRSNKEKVEKLLSM